MSTDPPADPSSENVEEPEEEVSYRASHAGISANGLEGAGGLRAAENLAELILDTVREALLVLDLDLRVQAANESFYQTFEVSPGETLGRLVYDLGNGQWDIPEMHELLEDVLTQHETFSDYEIVHDFEEIGRRYMLLNARQLEDHRLILLAIEDVTEREQTQRELRESEERLRVALEAADLGTWDLDLTTDTASVRSLRHDQIFGYDEPQEVWGQKTAMQHVLPEDRPAFREAFARSAETGILSFEVRVRWPDGSVHWIAPLGRTYYDDAGRPVRMAGVVQDVTEQKRAEEALRELASRLTIAEQQERRRISLTIHDELQQVLYGIRLKTDLLRKDAASGDRETLSREAVKVYELLGRAIATTRQLTVDLSPPVLQDEGLADTLAWLVTHMKDRHGLNVELQAAHAYAMRDEDLRVLLFQVVRELLFNVAKHAETDRASVALREEDGHLVIEVTDRGRGFDAAAAAADRDGGYGLFSVRERLGLFGGRMEIHSAAGEGTRVLVHTPAAPLW